MSLQTLFSQYAFVRVNGKSRVMDKKDGSLMTVADFKSYTANYPPVTNGNRQQSAASAWIESQSRETYSGIVFKPGEPPASPGKQYNSWQGWGVKPSNKGCCEAFTSLLYEGVCNSDDESYEYEILKMAHMVQKPQIKPGVASVYQGLKGTGKSALVRYLEKIVGSNYTVHASRTEDLIGKFNAELGHCLLLNAEEACWAGDKKGEGALKHLITEPNIRVEIKGVDAHMAPSYSRVYMTSNEDWVVPATGDERRYHVLKVNENFKGNKSFWDLFHQEMQSGGPEKLLQELLKYPIPADFNVHEPPKTLGLCEQIEQSLNPMQRWWKETLNNGSIRLPSYGGSDVFCSIHSDDKLQLPTRQKYADSFNHFQKQLRFGCNGSETEVTKFLTSLHGDNVKPIRPGTENPRPRRWQFSDLSLLRDDYDRKVVMTKWDLDDVNLKLVEQEDDQTSLEPILNKLLAE